MVCSDTSALPICYSSAPATILKVIGVLASLLRSGNSVLLFCTNVYHLHFPYQRRTFFAIRAERLVNGLLAVA